MNETRASKWLGARQLRGLTTVGDLLCPGTGRLPGFSATGCIAAVDRVLDPLPASDRRDLALLLGTLGSLPATVARMLVRLILVLARLPGPLGDVMRKARFGLRGTVLTLYYGAPQLLEAIGYRVSVYTEDLSD